jgi:polyphosphate glucokinase
MNNARRTATARSAAADKCFQTLAIDIGGTGLKADVLDSEGRIMAKPLRVPTPYPLSPEVLLDTLGELVEPLPSYDRVSVGFPGVVRDGRVVTAPHFGTEMWRGYPLETTVSHRFGKPARLLNDADVQGLGIVAGCGLEVVLPLGTGVGSAVFSDGRLAPHMELARHPIHKNKPTTNTLVTPHAGRPGTRSGISASKG